MLALIGCSQSEDIQINIPTTSEVENLIAHSEEFKQQVLSYETPGGRIHFAIGFGIANSIMVEGEDGNIIIDAADSIYEAEKIYQQTGAYYEFFPLDGKGHGPWNTMVSDKTLFDLVFDFIVKTQELDVH